MLLFNNKLAMSAKLIDPSFAFDPDKGKIVLRSRDFRTSGTFQLTFNGNTYKIESGGVLNYTLPVYDIEYPITYYQIPENESLQTSKYESKVFLNHPDCLNFRYGDYKSSHIIKYVGASPTVYIPDKHNMVSTLSAEILEFPNVESSELTVSTGAYMKTFNIKDPRITEFDIRCSTFIPSESQFEGLTNLTTVKFSTPITEFSKRMFYECKNFSMELDDIKKVSTFGEYAMYDVPKQKIIRCAASTLPKGVFDYSTSGEQKIIFTSASSVNGLTAKTLPTGTWTDGMLYNTNKKHQIFCDVSEALWPDEPCDTTTITFNGYSTSNQYLSFTTDYRVIGLELQAYSPSGVLKGHVYLIPYSSSATTTRPAFTITGNKKTFKCYYSYLYGNGYVNSADKIHIRPITSTGFMNIEYVYTAAGAFVSSSDENTTPNNSGLVLHAHTAGNTLRLPWTSYSGKYLILFSGSSSVSVGVFDKDGNRYPNAFRGTPTVETETTYGGTKIYKINLGSGVMYSNYLNSDEYFLRIATSEANLTRETYYIEAQMQVDYSIY